MISKTLLATALAVVTLTLPTFAQEISDKAVLHDELQSWRQTDGSAERLKEIFSRVSSGTAISGGRDMMAEAAVEAVQPGDWSTLASLYSEPIRTRSWPSVAVAHEVMEHEAWLPEERSPATWELFKQDVLSAGFIGIADNANWIPRQMAIYWLPNMTAEDLAGYLAADPRLVTSPNLRSFANQSDNIDLDLSWMLHFRHTLIWRSLHLNRYAKQVGILVTKAQGPSAGQAAITYVQTGEGVDPLAGVTLPQIVLDALPLVEDGLLKELLLGNYQAAFDTGKTAMAVADLEGDASAKKRAAKDVARVIFAKHGTLAKANAWLQAVSDETWRDYVLD